MPIRQVPASGRSLTGVLRNSRNGEPVEFESALERDLFLRLDFDPTVEFYEAQPCRIPWQHPFAGEINYTPDIFVRYREDPEFGTRRPNRLIEVKYSEELRTRWKHLQPKFKSAQTYAKSRGWRFEVLTETDIRTPYLDNVRFLLRYRDRESDTLYRFHICDLLVELGETTPQALLNALCQTRWGQAEAIPHLWNLVANFQIGTDLSRPLTMGSRIWPLQGTVD